MEQKCSAATCTTILFKRAEKTSDLLEPRYFNICFSETYQPMEHPMDKQRIEGGAKKVTGTIKEKVGQMVGDRHTEAEGRAEKTEGRIRSAVGQAKDAARELVGKK